LASCSSEIRGTYLLVVVSVGASTGASTGASAGAEAVVSSVTTAPKAAVAANKQRPILLKILLLFYIYN